MSGDPRVVAYAAMTRLNKRMGELGLASRREADAWIAAGQVLVNGRPATLGDRVGPADVITVLPAARAAQAGLVTILLNKPAGYVSGQAEDGYLPARVLIQPRNRWAEDRAPRRFAPEQLRHLVPAGRLDIDSTGLLVLTQDGRVARRLIDAASEVEKEYLVLVAAADGASLPTLDEGVLSLLRHGLSLDGRALAPAGVERLGPDGLRFILREGRKRQIRRMCEAVGLRVTRLRRVRVGRVELGRLPPGRWRYLRSDEDF